MIPRFFFYRIEVYFVVYIRKENEIKKEDREKEFSTDKKKKNFKEKIKKK